MGGFRCSLGRLRVCLSRSVRVPLLKVSLGPSRPPEPWQVSGIAQAVFGLGGDALEWYDVRNRMRTASCLGFGRRGGRKSDGGCEKRPVVGRKAGRSAYLIISVACLAVALLKDIPAPHKLLFCSLPVSVLSSFQTLLAELP